MQPYFFPYLGYFQLISAVDRFVFLDDVRFIKQGWINRNRILLAGKTTFLSVPVENPGLTGRICDLRIAGNAWRRKSLETLRHAYHGAPHFAETFELARTVIESGSELIGELAKQSVRGVCAALGIDSELVDGSASYRNAGLKAQDRILDIVGRERASEYVNASGGRSLYSATAFAAAGVRLRFLEPASMPYPQLTQQFVPDLSILDVMMNVGREGARALLGTYTLVD